MIEAHKKAMAQGRHQARAVKRYLDALEAGRKRGPKMTPEKLQTRIDDADRAIEDETEPAARVETHPETTQRPAPPRPVRRT